MEAAEHKKPSTHPLFFLPDDCWKQILSYIDNNHNLLHHRESLSLTCKQLLSTTNNLPFTLSLTAPLFSHPDLLRRILRRFSSSLHSLDFHSFSGDIDSALSFISSSTTADLRHLHRLSLSICPTFPITGLRQLAQWSNGLKVLDFYNCGSLSDDHLIEVCNIIPLIEEIDVSVDDNGVLSDVGIVYLAQKLKTLKKINLSGHPLISDHSLIALSDYCLGINDVGVLGCKSVTQHGIGYMLRHCSKLGRIMVNTSVTVNPCSTSCFSIEDSVGFCTSLSTLEFYAMEVEDSLLCSIAKANLPLRIFTVFYCEKLTLQGLSTFLRAYTKLERLELQWASFLTDKVVEGLVCYFRNLVAVNLVSCYELTEASLCLLVKHCPVLEEIKMENAKLGGGKFGEVFVKGEKIKCLGLAGNKFLMDEKLRAIGLMCPNLQHLDLGGCWFLTSQDIGAILQSCREIRHLLVSGWVHSMLFDMDLEGPVLNLEMLQLGGSMINDECLSVIAQACLNLLVLNLAYCDKITSEGVKKLINSCTRLQNISLLGCSYVSSDIVSWMVLARPSLRKIAAPRYYMPTDTDEELFLNHGCFVEQPLDGHTDDED